MLQPVDSSILHEIVRVIEARRKVPGRVQVRAREYQITYLEDHQRRLEEALHRYDADRLNMLFGQLASKVKYQMLRRVPERATKAKAKKPAPRSPAKAKAKRPAAVKPVKKPKAKATPPKKRRTVKPTKRKAPAAKKKVAARKRSAKKKK